MGTRRSRRRPKRLALTVAVALVALLAPAQALGGVFSFTFPVNPPGDPESVEPIGHIRVRWDDSLFRLSVRGSVRLDAGDWCIRTSARPRRNGAYRSKIDYFTIQRPGVRAVPRFERLKLPRFFYGENRAVELVRVTVRQDTCSGPLVASSSYSLGGPSG